MQLKEFGVSLGDLIHEFNFEVVYGPEGFEKTEITKDDVNRPGLQLAGFLIISIRTVSRSWARLSQLCRGSVERGAPQPFRPSVRDRHPCAAALAQH